jgi:TfoX/Sxy family transcriptional regulator of competence genes
MAYDEGLAERLREALAGRGAVSEKKMFGGLAFMLAGNMCVGIIGDELIVRPGPEGGDRALDEPHTRPMDFTGRPMTGWIIVGTGAIATEPELTGWVDRAVEYVSTLPAK